MRIAWVALLALCALPGVADGPKVNRGMIEAMEHSLDHKLSGLWPQDPVEVLGVSQGTYIRGYGAVFLSEVNLAPRRWNPSVPSDRDGRMRCAARTRRKMQRMAAHPDRDARDVDGFGALAGLGSRRRAGGAGDCRFSTGSGKIATDCPRRS